jgi:hypothetical protein
MGRDARPRSRGVFRPRFAVSVASSEIRGRREDRVRAAPAVSCAKCTNKNAHEHTGSAEAVRPSLRNGFTAYNALSPVTGLSCHRHQRNDFRQLDASVGASGPRDFAVRIRRSRQLHPPRPPHPAPNVRDDREAPLLWARDGRSCSDDFPDALSGVLPGVQICRTSATVMAGSHKQNRPSAIRKRAVIASG